MINITKLLVLLLLPLTFILACTQESELTAEELRALPYKGEKTVNEIVVHELSDPDKLNPICSQGAGATYIEHNIFMYLLDVNKENLDIIPWLAKDLPVVTKLEEGSAYKMRVDYEIKPEAVWDNGTPVTGYDVAFSYKVTMNPFVDSEHQRPYIDMVEDIIIDPDNPKRFSLYLSELHFAADFTTGGVIYIIPPYVYDPDGIMEQFELKDLSDPVKVEQLKENQALLDFGNEFNTEFYQREVGGVVGCGPYRFAGWETGQRIVLEKKEDWWGQAYADDLSFEQHSDRIIYEIINDKVTAITAMKDEGLDVMRSMRPKDFSDLQKSESFNERFFLFHPQTLSYTYIGVNMKHPILGDKKVRQAIAHCVDVEMIIDILMYGYATQINSVVHPSKPYYNDDLSPYDYNLEKAAALLKEAGWEDTDGDGVLDKVIDGVKTPLRLSIKYNSGNDTREKVCLFLQESAQKIGIEIDIMVREWAVYLDECSNHDFDLYVLGWIQEAVLDDPKQTLHSESYNGGSNYPGFGSAESDRLIELIRTELDDELRYDYFKKLQAMVQDEVPYILLYSPDNTMAISKRFGNADAYIARPGYDERELKLQPYKGAVQ